MLTTVIVLAFLVGGILGGALGWQIRGFLELRAATASTAGDDGTVDPVV